VLAAGACAIAAAEMGQVPEISYLNSHLKVTQT
jgi:hypothetical protein